MKAQLSKHDIEIITEALMAFRSNLRESAQKQVQTMKNSDNPYVKSCCQRNIDRLNVKICAALAIESRMEIVTPEAVMAN